LTPDGVRIEAILAKRQQRSGESEGQGEDGVLELDHVEHEAKTVPEHAGNSSILRYAVQVELRLRAGGWVTVFGICGG
jgi:hypothetical protein